MKTYCVKCRKKKTENLNSKIFKTKIVLSVELKGHDLLKNKKQKVY